MTVRNVSTPPDPIANGLSLEHRDDYLAAMLRTLDRYGRLGYGEHPTGGIPVVPQVGHRDSGYRAPWVNGADE